LSGALYGHLNVRHMDSVAEKHKVTHIVGPFKQMKALNCDHDNVWPHLLQLRDKNQDTRTPNTSFENVTKFKYMGTAVKCHVTFKKK
jgi:hypothetical protein